jgi:hypothetical protein
VIDDLDRTLQELLRRELPPGVFEQVSVSFAAPDNSFPPASVVLPAVDLFLYDVRENLDLRAPGWDIDYRNDGTAMRQRKPIRIDCSYLITAWPSESSPTPAFDEHLLLSEVMRALLRHPTIPEGLLFGKLRGQTAPLPASTLHPGKLQSLAEFWQAMGGKPKAALNYTVTIGLIADQPVETDTIVREKEVRFWPEPEVDRERSKVP